MFIATIAPYVQHRQQIAEHPLVGQLRFNTIMPIGESKADVLSVLKQVSGRKKLLLDLKTRQLRITEFSYLPFAYVKISRKIKVDLPCAIIFKDCVSEIVKITDGNKLILSKRPVRVVGAGEPVNILDPSLQIEGFLSENDCEYIEEAKKLDIHSYLLSFVESKKDIDELLKADPDAEVIAKIESERGIRFVKEEYRAIRDRVRLMAARDDLFINMGEAKPRILSVLKTIIGEDCNAIAASRILTSLETNDDVSMGDISDLTLLALLGYGNFLLSDGLCFSESAFKKMTGVLRYLIPEIEAVTGRVINK